MDVEVKRTQEYSRKTEVPTPKTKDLLLAELMKESQQCKVTVPKGDKNQNGKRITETKTTGNKDKKLSKKREKIEWLQKVPEGTSQKEGLQDWNFARILEQRNMALCHGEAI